MEDFIESTNYLLDEKDESSYIEEINSLLKNLENLLKFNSDEMNQTKIIDATNICEFLLKLLIKKEGYL